MRHLRGADGEGEWRGVPGAGAGRDAYRLIRAIHLFDSRGRHEAATRGRRGGLGRQVRRRLDCQSQGSERSQNGALGGGSVRSNCRLAGGHSGTAAVPGERFQVSGAFHLPHARLTQSDRQRAHGRTDRSDCPREHRHCGLGTCNRPLRQRSRARSRRSAPHGPTARPKTSVATPSSSPAAAMEGTRR